MIEITREQANEILKTARHGPMQKCTIAYKGKWYDTRGMTDGEIEGEVAKLLGVKVEQLPGMTANIVV